MLFSVPLSDKKPINIQAAKILIHLSYVIWPRSLYRGFNRMPKLLPSSFKNQTESVSSIKVESPYLLFLKLDED